MTQKISNGFPQYFDFTYLKSRFFGTIATQADQTKTDIDLVNDTVGDVIQVDNSTLNLLEVSRDGAHLHEDQGFELIAPNIIRVVPGLLDNETLEFSFFTGSSGVVTQIPVIDPAPGGDGIDQTFFEALAYTDNSSAPINAFNAFVILGKTRVTAQFTIDVGRVDVYLNGTRAGANSGLWTLVDPTTIELDDDYSTTKMKVEIVKQIVG